MNSKEEQSLNDETALTQRDEHIGFFAELWQQVRLVYKLLLDPEVPIYLKALPFAAFLYLLFPVDFLPDVIPGIGQIDDITVLILGAKMFIELAPNQVVARHLQNMRGQGEYNPALDEQSVDELYPNDPDVIEGVLVEDSIVVDQGDDDPD